MAEGFFIIPFEKRLKSHFKRLNEEWLEKYFVVEPYDAQLLENCEKEIIEKGGHIFFGCLDNSIIGTYSILPPKNNVVELGKMAVTASFQGKGYGQQLLHHAIKTATENGYKQILLYSNTRLENSIYLYRKFGFIEEQIEESPYERGNIKMRLKL